MKRKALYSRAKRARATADRGANPGLPQEDWFAAPQRPDR